MSNSSKFYTFGLNLYSDNRGKLVSLVDIENIPFQVKRIYYLLDFNLQSSRGNLAHTVLEQVLVCVSGECKILLDDGKEKNIIKLDKFNEALYINKGLWRKIFDFSSDCIVFSLNSEFYDENEIIRDYEQFIDYSKRQES